ncbi:hypothetical protein U0070_009867 [Myodes glareolus]|uniref:ATP synthase F(0) complex subunit e, mitochondrial n=2 Tax=Myodes glareolus TaxID=447135 RepID=A0AAW0HWX4_MYOGA
MVPPVQVSPLIKRGRYSALVFGMAYGTKRYSYLKPWAEEERRVAAEEKKRLDELKRIERERAEAQDDSILKDLSAMKTMKYTMDEAIIIQQL